MVREARFHNEDLDPPEHLLRRHRRNFSFVNGTIRDAPGRAVNKQGSYH